ncbi:hypothetical protein QUB47_10530 [Microcoleus sp. AT9_B5]
MRELFVGSLIRLDRDDETRILYDCDLTAGIDKSRGDRIFTIQQ